MSEMNQRACDQLLPEYWHYWRGICLTGCSKVSTCPKFIEGRTLYEFNQKQARRLTGGVGK